MKKNKNHDHGKQPSRLAKPARSTSKPSTIENERNENHESGERQDEKMKRNESASADKQLAPSEEL